MSTLTVPADTLLARARQGDQQALDDLLRAHRDSITAVCRRRLRSPADAEDAAQETMVRAMGALDAVRDETRLRSYLCRIAERVCLDMMRAGARPTPVTVPPVAQEEPESSAIRREEAEMVRRTLQALSARQAQALWMRDAMGEPVPAIAEKLGMTEGSTRVLLTRARRQMRDGWAKVAALVPGFGLKLPAPLAKVLGTSGIVPAVLAPTAVLVAAVLVLPGLGGAPNDDRAVDQPADAPAIEVAQPVPARSPVTRPPTVATGAELPLPTRRSAPAGATTTGATAAGTADGTIAAGPVLVDRQDRDEDDVTAGDPDTLGIGASLGEAFNQTGLAAEQPVELSGDRLASVEPRD